MVKRTIVLYSASILGSFYTAYVLTVLWSWFVTPAFGLPRVSFWIMYGLTMIIGLLRSPGDIEAEHRNKIAAVMLDVCIPAERREEVTEQLSEFSEEIWARAGLMVFAQAVINTLAIALGFVVHVLAS